MTNKFKAQPMKLMLHLRDSSAMIPLLRVSIKGDLHALEIERMDESDIEVHHPKLTSAGIHGSRKHETYMCEVKLDADLALKLMYVLMDGDLQQQHMALKQDKVIFHAAMSRDKRWTIVPNDTFSIE